MKLNYAMQRVGSIIGLILVLISPAAGNPAERNLCVIHNIGATDGYLRAVVLADFDPSSKEVAGYVGERYSYWSVKLPASDLESIHRYLTETDFLSRDKTNLTEAFGDTEIIFSSKTSTEHFWCNKIGIVHTVTDLYRIVSSVTAKKILMQWWLARNVISTPALDPFNDSEKILFKQIRDGRIDIPVPSSSK